MTLLYLLLAPIAGLILFSLTVVFWTGLSQLKFLAFYRGEGMPPPPMGAGGWALFYRRTLRGALYLLWWSIRAAGQAGYRQPAGRPSGRPVLCVHGIFMNSTCMWGIRSALQRDGRGTRSVSLGMPIPTPMVYAKPLASVMDEMATSFPDQGFDVVAHSLGGVMLREVLRQRPDLAPSIGRIVTLGTPHHGTAFVRWLRFGPLYQMLNRQSTYLRDLPAFAELAPAAKVTTVATRHDLVVYPIESALLAGTEKVILDDISHLGLMCQPAVMEIVVEALEDRGT